MRTRSPTATFLATCLVLLPPATARAGDHLPFQLEAATAAANPGPELPPAGRDATAPHAAASTTGPAFGTAVAADHLDTLRGGQAVTTTVADTRGRVDGNSATNVVGGANLVSDGSFANAAGISTVIQNSGSNVLIQNSTVVSVQFTDPGR